MFGCLLGCLLGRLFGRLLWRLLGRLLRRLLGRLLGRLPGRSFRFPLKNLLLNAHSMMIRDIQERRSQLSSVQEVERKRESFVKRGPKAK